MESQILSPRSIAIVGVSDQPDKIGSALLRNLIDGGYNGKIYPVNPKHKELQKRKTYPDILSIEDNVEMVCIAIPHQFVESVVDQCVEKKVKSVVIISAGFKETGKQGKELEERITEKLKNAKIRVLGPNCLGYINNKAKINLTFARENPGNGNIAFISQSGAFCTTILDMASEKKLGFSHVISLGNKADIHENELLTMFLNDSDVAAIAIYLEEFADGKELVSICQKSKKPILIIAPGSSEKSQLAISSHTGSLASSYDTTLAAIKKGNMILAENSEELFKLIEMMNLKSIPKGKRVAIITNAGGPGIIAVDRTEKEGLEVVEFGEKTKEKLLKILPEESNITNPVDILGDAKKDRYEFAIETVLDDINVDCLLVILTPQLITDIEGTAKAIAKLSLTSPKPIYSCFLGGKYVREGQKILEQNKCPWFNDLQEAIHITSKLAEYEINREVTRPLNTDTLYKKPKYQKEIQNILDGNSSIVLPDSLAISILEEFEIETPKQLVTTSLEEGRDFASLIFPVAIKATAEDLAHKTDFKALFLDIRTISEFEERFEILKQTITKTTGNPAPNILVQEMIEGNLEFFIGANREGDSDIYEKEGLGFGHLIAMGKGGTFTEVYRDITHALVPEKQEDIEMILSKTKVSRIINGYRGKPKLAREKLIELIMKIQSMLISYPEIVSMDINPVMLTEEKAVVVDIKLYLKS